MFEMARAIPLLDFYEQGVRGTEAQVVMLCANNYPAKYAGNPGFENMFYFNRLVREKCGLNLVEVSDDCWEPSHLINADGILEHGDHIKRIESAAQDAGVYMVAMGTGAFLSYQWQKGLGVALFDLPRKGQNFLLRMYDAWAALGSRTGVQLITGRRPGILDDASAFSEAIPIGEISDYIASVSDIRLGPISLGNISPTDEITKSEAMNLALALRLNRQNPRVMQLVEQMQYAGMEPNTVEQVVRVNQFLSANLPRGYFADMADNGHVGVRGTRKTLAQRDFDLFSYADAYVGPILFIHHNILFENAKQPGTAANLDRDRRAQRQAIPARDMPHPSVIRDINDYLIRAIDNPNVSLAIASPEPKCQIDTDLGQLAGDVAEATQITAERIRQTGRFVESGIIPLTFITRDHRERLDDLLRRLVA